MSNDEPMEDVDRWYYGGTAPETYRNEASIGDDAIGYEAAHPALQALHWPDAAWTPGQATP